MWVQIPPPAHGTIKNIGSNHILILGEENFNHMNQRGFVNIISIVVIVALVAVAWYFALIKKSGSITEQTPTYPVINKTRNWKIYTNDQYGFEFKYPAEWTRNDGQVIQSAVLRLDFYSPDYKGRFDYRGGDFPQTIIESGGHFSINIDSLKGLLPYDFEKLQKELKQYESSEGVDRTKEIQVNKVNAIYHFLKNFVKETSSADIHFLHPRDATLQFQIMISSATVEKNQYYSVLDQILSTFKFVN